MTMVYPRSGRAFSRPIARLQLAERYDAHVFGGPKTNRLTRKEQGTQLPRLCAGLV